MSCASFKKKLEETPWLTEIIFFFLGIVVAVVIGKEVIEDSIIVLVAFFGSYLLVKLGCFMLGCGRKIVRKGIMTQVEVMKFLGEKFFNELKEMKNSTLAEVALFAFQRKVVNHGIYKETCIPGVYSFNGVHDLLREVKGTALKAEAEVVAPTLPMKKVIKSLVGKKRTKAHFKEMQAAVVKGIQFFENRAEKHGGGAPEDVSLKVHFPDRLDSAQLIEFMKHNPFFTAGMHYDEESNRYCFDATAESKNELNALIFAAFPKWWACSKLWFDKDLTFCRVEVNGVEYDPDKDEDNLKLRPFITAATYHFEVLHSVLHVYLYVMLGAANQATFKTELESFIKQYQDQILIKYIEVESALLGGLNVLKGAAWGPINDSTLVDKAAKAVFEKYAACKTSEQWLNEIFLADCPELQLEAEVLAEARKYQILFVNLATTTMRTFEAQYQTATGFRSHSLSITKGLRKYLSKSNGTDFTMKKFDEWIECQGMAGVLHGNTLSYTRLMFTDYLVQNGEWDTDVFDPTIAVDLSIAAGTLIGLKEENAINMSVSVEQTPFEAMMRSIEKETEQLQESFWNSLDKDDKRDYTWCKSVWGPNMEDSTQLTITAYV